MNIARTVLFAIACISIQPAFASGPHWLAYGTGASGYVFINQGYVVSRNPVTQGGLTASWNSGWYAGAWASEDLPVKSLTKGPASEVDFLGGWEGSCGHLTCHGQLAYYAEPTIGTGKHDIVNLLMEVKKSYALSKKSSLGWYAGFEHYFLFGTGDTDVFYGGGTGSYALTAKWNASGSLGYGYDRAPSHPQATYTADVSYDAGHGWTWTPVHVEGFIPLTHGRKSDIVVGMKLSKTF